MDWINEVIKEYVTKERIRTTPERTQALYDYFVQQGFDSVGLVCDALTADSNTQKILLPGGCFVFIH